MRRCGLIAPASLPARWRPLVLRDVKRVRAGKDAGAPRRRTCMMRQLNRYQPVGLG